MEVWEGLAKTIGSRHLLRILAQLRLVRLVMVWGQCHGGLIQAGALPRFIVGSLRGRNVPGEVHRGLRTWWRLYVGAPYLVVRSQREREREREKSVGKEGVRAKERECEGMMGSEG